MLLADFLRNSCLNKQALVKPKKPFISSKVSEREREREREKERTRLCLSRCLIHHEVGYESEKTEGYLAVE